MIEPNRVPIIIFSGFERETDIADAIAAGADVCCEKPCLPETLLGEINKLLFRSEHGKSVPPRAD